FEEITIEEWTTFQKFLIVGGAVAIVAATACYLNPVCLLAVYKAFGATFGGITLLTKGVAYGANGAIVAIEGVSPAQFIELSAEFLRLNNLKNPTLFGVARAAEYNRYILDAAARLFGFIK
ncbi:MAG: hypothetical protein O2897_00560, partial [bacterium]|nr:hypothetical protein [bacterium]